MRIRQVVLQLQVVVEMRSDRGGMAASDRGGNGGFKLTMMAASNQQQWSLQTRGNGSGLIGKGEGINEGEGIWFEEEREREHGLERDKFVRRERKS